MRCAVRSLTPALLVAALGAPASAQPHLIRLGFLGENGPSIANAITPDGQVVAGYSVAPGGLFHAFRWTAAGGLQDLGVLANPGGFEASMGMGLSPDGGTVVGSSLLPNSLNEDGSPFRWTGANGMQFLGNMGGTDGGWAFAASTSGAVIVGSMSSPDFSYKAFRWVSPGPPAPMASITNQAFAKALCISPDGGTAAGYASPGSNTNNRPVVWRSAGTSVLQLTGLSVNAIGAVLAMTPDGATFVGQSGGRAVRWRSTTPENLGEEPGGIPQTTYMGEGVSSDGNTVVGLGNLNQGQGLGNAIIWDPVHGMRDLNVVAAAAGVDLSHFFLFDARAISADGLTIAGYGFSDTDQEAFVLDLHSGPAPCYPNCDSSTSQPVLNVADFTCFLQKFAAADPYANCDASTSQPALNVADFTCFLQKFAAGCA